MKKTTFYLLFILIVSGVLFVGCSDDTSSTHPPIDPEATDVTNGCTHAIIDVDAPTNIRLHTQRNVTFDYDDTHISLFVQKIGDHRFISHSFNKSIDNIELPLTLKVGLKIEGDGEDAELHKELYITFRRFTSSTPISPDVNYARAIGKGTQLWGDIGNVEQPILDFNAIYSDLSINENFIDESISFETSGERYTSSLEKMAVGAGLSGTVPIKGLLLSGSASYGYEKTETKSNHFEYYMGYYGKKMSEVKLNKDKLIVNKIALLDTIVNHVLNNSQSEYYKLYDNTKEGIYELLDNYGTHVISRAVFGGNYTVLFAREENAYEESIGHDAAAEITATTPLKSTSSWAKIYCQMTNSTALKVNASGSNYSEEYHNASKSYSIITAKGGNASKDIELWDASITADSKNSWVPISYLTKDANNQEDNGLISIAEFCVDPERKKALEDYIETYYKEHVDTLTEAPMIIVDFMMKAGDNDHRAGNPKSFVAKDPYGIYRIYYPMMANTHAPLEDGYAIETSQQEYIVATDKADHYWYYALGHLDKEAGVYGIVNIIFDNKDNNGYTRRGDHSDTEISGLIDNNYVMLKYASKDTPEDQIITGIGLRRKSDGKIMASTGGTEMVYPWGADDSRYNKYWGDSNSYDYNDDYNWFKGGLVFNCNFYPAYTTQPLDINFCFGDGNYENTPISHPRKWGE